MFQTLHKNYTRKPTTQLYILFFEHESNESNGWSEWIVRNESDVCYVRNERDGRNERTGVTKGRAGDGVTELSREQSFIISFKSAPFLKN